MERSFWKLTKQTWPSLGCKVCSACCEISNFVRLVRWNSLSKALSNLIYLLLQMNNIEKNHSKFGANKGSIKKASKGNTKHIEIKRNYSRTSSWLRDFWLIFFLALDSFFIDVTQVLGSLFTSAQVSPWFGSEEPHNKICMKASNTCHKRNTESLLCQATPDQFSLFDSWNAGNWPWTTRDPHLHQEWNEKKSSTNWAEPAVKSKWSSYRRPILILLTELTYPYHPHHPHHAHHAHHPHHPNPYHPPRCRQHQVGGLLREALRLLTSFHLEKDFAFSIAVLRSIKRTLKNPVVLYQIREGQWLYIHYVTITAHEAKPVPALVWPWDAIWPSIRSMSFFEDMAIFMLIW